jgi:hypothetical protein
MRFARLWISRDLPHRIQSMKVITSEENLQVGEKSMRIAFRSEGKASDFARFEPSPSFLVNSPIGLGRIITNYTRWIFI